MRRVARLRIVRQKGYLMTPGPTPIPPEVAEALGRPIVYHRSSAFRDVLTRVLQQLPEVFRSSGEIVLFTASGTAAMESAVANLCTPGDRVVAVSAGYFGERWREQYGEREQFLGQRGSVLRGERGSLLDYRRFQ